MKSTTSVCMCFNLFNCVNHTLLKHAYLLLILYNFISSSDPVCAQWSIYKFHRLCLTYKLALYIYIHLNMNILYTYTNILYQSNETINKSIKWRFFKISIKNLKLWFVKCWCDATASSYFSYIYNIHAEAEEMNNYER